MVPRDVKSADANLEDDGGDGGFDCLSDEEADATFVERERLGLQVHERVAGVGDLGVRESEMPDLLTKKGKF